MSKKIEATLTCPECSHKFSYSLYRSIWGEIPDNRSLVMSDKINFVACPQCGQSSQILFPFLYVNTKQFFAVWWEPEYDPQIDFDQQSYIQMFGEGNFYSTAPRIKDWNEFKQTILKFERGELKGKKPVVSNEMQILMRGFTEHIKNTNKKKSGCLTLLLAIFFITACLWYTVML